MTIPRLEAEISTVRKQLDSIQSLLVRKQFLTTDIPVSPETVGDSISARMPVMILSDSGFMKALGLREDLGNEILRRERTHHLPGSHESGKQILVIQRHHARA
jgi:hypothetical protein